MTPCPLHLRPPQAIRPRRRPGPLVSLLGGEGLFPQRAQRGQAALHDRHSAAERDRGPAPGPRPEQHAARHPHPPEADAGLRDALDARHRPCRHRHPGGGRAAAAGRREAQPATTWAARAWSPASGSGRTTTKPASSASSSRWAVAATGSGPASRSTRSAPGGPAHVLQPLPRRPDLPRQAAGELGHDAANGRQRRRGVPRGGGRPFLVLQLSGDRSAAGRAART